MALLAAGIGGVSYVVIAIVAAVIFGLVQIYALYRSYKKCPPDKAMIVFGKVGTGGFGKPAEDGIKIIHAGGAAFIWPIIQDYKFLDLKPIDVEVKLKGSLSRENERVDFSSRLSVGVSKDPATLQIAAERILGSTKDQIAQMVKDMTESQLRMVLGSVPEAELRLGSEVLYESAKEKIETEIKKIGLELINLNITDIKLKQ